MDLATINLMRASSGLEPLTELPGATPAAGGEGNKDVVETPEQVEAKRLQAEADADKKLEDEKNKTNTLPDELDDAQLMAFLQKRGISVASLDDLKPKVDPVDPVLLAEQREANELAYGLSKGLFNKKEYDQFVADAQDPQELVYDEYHADAKKEDPTLTDEDIQAEFLAKYGLDAEPDTRKFKRGVKEIAALAKVILNERHNKIFKAKDAFSGSEKETLTASARQKKIAAALPTYNKDVEEIFTALKKIPVKFSDTETYEVEAIEADLNVLKADMLKPEYYSAKIDAGYDKETLKQTVFAGFLYKHWPTLAMEVANQHLRKHAAGTHGVPLLGGKTKEGDVPVLTPAQQKMVDLVNAQKAKETATTN